MTDSPSSQHTRSLDPQTAFAELGKITLGSTPLGAVLERVADLAVQTIPGKNQVSVTLLDRNRPRSVAFTGEVAVALDERQYDAGFGPCMDAAESGATIVISDTATDKSYPEFSKQAKGNGVNHTLSVGMPIPQHSTGGLNVYGFDDEAYDEHAVGVAQAFASYAAVALANAALLSDTAELADQMQKAMASRAVIDQAKGILMAAHHCSADEAFAMLSAASQRANRKLRDLAADMVRTIQDQEK